MFGLIVGVSGVVLLGIGAAVGIFVVGMRSGWSPVVDAVRRNNRTRLNPKQMETAGQAGAEASILRHTGRVSGIEYETPLDAIPTDDGFAIALVYGDRTEWLKNVLASGSATIVREGSAYEVGRPEVVPIAQEKEYFSTSDRRSQRILGTRTALLLRHVGTNAAPG